MNFPVIRPGLWPDFEDKNNMHSYFFDGWVFQQYGPAHVPEIRQLIFIISLT